MDIVYLPQVHTFQDESGIQSQKNICNYLIEKFEENPNKHYYIFFESDCVQELFDFYTNPNDVLIFMQDFEGVAEVIQDELPKIAPFFKTKLDFEKLNARTWLRDLTKELESHEDHVKDYILNTVFTNYDKYRIYSYIYGLRWVHEYVLNAPNLNVTYIPVPCFQRAVVVENKIEESLKHYKRDILAVIDKYMTPFGILKNVKGFFENQFDTNPQHIDMTFLHEYKENKTFQKWFRESGVVGYPPKHFTWKKTTQTEFENELLDAIFSDITFTNREYLTIEDIQQYLINDTYNPYKEIN
jgi:hypothetical protein